jgi:hypothetical protein
MNINWIRITKVGNAAPVVATSEIAAKAENNVLIVYPNPVVDLLSFTTDVIGGKTTVIDAQGTVVDSQKINENSLNVSQLKQGIYFLILEKDGKQTLKRFIKK